jgi:hypothetical protein
VQNMAFSVDRTAHMRRARCCGVCKKEAPPSVQ